MQQIGLILFLVFACTELSASVTAKANASQQMVNPKSTPAKATSHPKEEKTILGLLEALNTFETEFFQTTFNKEGKKIQEVKGIIKSKRPSSFYWQAYKPYPQLLVTDGKTIWQYDEDLQQVTLKDYNTQRQQANLVKIFENPKTLLENYRLTGETHGRKNVTYHLAGIKDGLAVKTLAFSFNGKKLSNIEFIDALGQKTIMAFSKFQIKKTIADKNFRFTIPKSADVIDDRPVSMQNPR